jgi:uncharacterized protein
MEFTNEITLDLPTDDVFAALTDVERVASCLPGARVEGRDGEAYRGAMRIKVGPILADYRGSLSFAELDQGARRAVLLASGQEATGQGSAQARIVSRVVEEGDRARVIVQTDLQVAGRVAQFGSGAMEKIAKRMFADFARNLERLMLNEATSEKQHLNGSGPTAQTTLAAVPAGGSTTAAASPPGRPASVPANTTDSLDVMDLVGEPIARVLRGAVPVGVALLIGYLIGQLRARPPARR